MKNKIGQLALMAAMFSQFGESSLPRTNPEDIDTTPKEPVIPKGCQKFTFVESWGTLEVVAMNKKSAMKKYNKWYAENSEPKLPPTP